MRERSATPGQYRPRIECRPLPVARLLAAVSMSALWASAQSAAIELSDIAAGKHGFVINGANPDDRAGSSVTGVGDVNGDGLHDIALIADTVDSLPNFEEVGNKCYVVFGKPGTAPINLSEINLGGGGYAIIGSPGFNSASSIAGVGDINGDGLDDVLIGCPLTSAPGRPSSGAAFVAFGKQNTTAIDISDLAIAVGGFAIHGANANEAAADFVREAGDVNGDGRPDLIVANGRGTDSICVVFGKADSNAVDLADVAAGVGGFVIYRSFDSAGAPAGDVNGDGRDDIIVQVSGLFRIAEAVIFGKSNTATVNAADIDASADGFVIEQAIFGETAGDVNGDGLDDIIVHDARSIGQPQNAFVVFGKQDTAKVQTQEVALGIGGFPIWQEFDGDIADSSAAGDVNGDGLADLLLGVSFLQERAGVQDAGYIVYGKQNNAAVTQSALRAGFGGFAINRISSGDFTGLSVDAAGDVNGDGFSDVVIGAPGACPGARTDAGEVFIVFGGHPPFQDTDTDALSDSAETNTGILARPWDTGTDPDRADSDQDGVHDGDELRLGTDPNNRQVSPATLPPQHIVTLSSVVSGARGRLINGRNPRDMAGMSVSGAGDVNGDGVDDVIVGAPRATAGTRAFAGQSFIVFGSPLSAPVYVSDVARGVGGFVINGSQYGDHSGEVSKAGDINGDGLDDLLISGSFGLAKPGRPIYVVFGKTDTLPVQLSNIEAGRGGGCAILDPAAPTPTPGSIQSPSGIGDVNGDGLGDLVLQYVGYDNPHYGAVVFGKTNNAPIRLADVLLNIDGFAIDGLYHVDRSNFTGDTASVGDVNGDGLNDFAFADSAHAVPGRGPMYIIFGKAQAETLQLADVAAGIGGFAIEGTFVVKLGCIAGAGDVNADGLADFVIGDLSRDQDNTRGGGQSYVVFGKQNTNPVDLAIVAAGVGGFAIRGAMATFSGVNVSGAGDVNGDGLPDIAIAGSIYDQDYYSPLTGPRGTCYVVYGKANTAPVELFALHFGTGGFVIGGRDDRDAFGASVSGAGDLNGDGLDDLIVGAPSSLYPNLNAEDPGHAYVIYGFKPTAPDSDQDLIPDYAETGTGVYIDGEDTGTDPSDPDSDGDGVLDGIEVDLGTDPNNPLDFPILPLGHRILFATLIGIAAACLIWPLAPRRADGKGKT